MKHFHSPRQGFYFGVMVRNPTINILTFDEFFFGAVPLNVQIRIKMLDQGTVVYRMFKHNCRIAFCRWLCEQPDLCNNVCEVSFRGTTYLACDAPCIEMGGLAE